MAQQQDNIVFIVDDDRRIRRIAPDHPHIVFITGHGDIPSSVRAMKTGAVDFLTKPFKEQDLMRATPAKASRFCRR